MSVFIYPMAHKLFTFWLLNYSPHKQSRIRFTFAPLVWLESYLESIKHKQLLFIAGNVFETHTNVLQCMAFRIGPNSPFHSNAVITYAVTLISNGVLRNHLKNVSSNNMLITRYDIAKRMAFKC